MKKMSVWLLLLVASVAFIQCKNNAKGTTELKTEADGTEEFDSFYAKFHEDSSFQVSRIVFPLEGRPAVTSDTVDLTNFRWTAQTWKYQRPIHPDSTQFVSLFNDMGPIRQEIMDIPPGFFIERRFTKTDGKWYLIYYSDVNRRSN